MELSESFFFDTLTIQNDQISYVKHVLAYFYVFFTCLCSPPASAPQKWNLSETDFFDTLTIQNDQISYVKHVLAPLSVFFTLFVCVGGGGLPRGLGPNLLMQFSSFGSSKVEFSETAFFDILTIQNDQISYVKHVLAPLYVLSTLFVCVWGGGGRGSQGV